MTVLGIREALRGGAQNGRAAPALRPAEPVPPAPKQPMRNLLEELLAEFQFVYLCFIDSSGLTSETSRPLHPTGDLARLRTVLHALATTYPRAGLARVFVQDGDGTVVLASLINGSYLVAVSDTSALPGQVLISAGKVSARIVQALAPAPERAGAP
jgi:hypothetical protein